jgi:hypothetical protein
VNPLLISGHWIPVQDGDPRAVTLFERHYSCSETQKQRRHRRGARKIMGPGEYLLLLTADCNAVFGWRRANRPDRAGQAGVYCSIFRNEGNILSSELVQEACELAWRRWPGERLYTYIDAGKIQSTNPGYCFKVVGWQACGVTQVNKLVILERLPQEAAA